MPPRVIETKAIISAQDQTGATFAQVAQKLKAMEGAAQRANGRVNAVNSNLSSTMQRQGAMTAAGAAVGAAALMAAERGIDKVSELARRTAETYREYDDLVRKQRAILGIVKKTQQPLIDQAIHMGATNKFNDLQVLDAQLSLAQRGIKTDLIQPITKFAADFGQAMGVDLPTSAKVLESALFSTGQNMETAADALKNSQRVTDLMVKITKIGGLSAEGVQMGFKFGGAAAHAAGLSIETMGAMMAMMSRGGISGDEAGVAIRSISGSLVSPTKKALMALDALGIDFDKYTKMPGGMSANNLGMATQRELGKTLNQSQKDRIQELMENPDLASDRQGFTSAMTEIIGEGFEKSKHGGLKAQDSQTIAKVVGNFWKSAIESVDPEKLLRDIIAANPSAAQANTIFTKQQGGRFQTMSQQGMPMFLEFYDTLAHTPAGFAGHIGEERMGGFAGAESRLAGAKMNFLTALGRANEGWATQLDNAEGKFLQGMVDGGNSAMHLVTAVGGAVTAIVLFESALKTAAIVQTMAGNPASAAAIAGLGGGALGRLGAFAGGFGFAAGVAGLGYIGHQAYKNYNAVDGDSPPTNWAERMGDNFDHWAGWGRWSPGSQLKRAGIGGVSPGLSSFGFGAGGSPTPVKLEGSAGINLKIEVSADSDSVVKKVAQFISTSGNMRDDTGTTMAPTQ
jgi:hypothetical protein